MRIIIDTNVLVSAALKDGNPEQVILSIAAHPEKYQWLVSPEISTEYKGVLSRRKLGLPKSTQERWFKLIDAFATLVDVDISIDFPRDRKDAKFLACAAIAPDYPAIAHGIATHIGSVDAGKLADLCL